MGGKPTPQWRSALSAAVLWAPFQYHDQRGHQRGHVAGGAGGQRCAGYGSTPEDESTVDRAQRRAGYGSTREYAAPHHRDHRCAAGRAAAIHTVAANGEARCAGDGRAKENAIPHSGAQWCARDGGAGEGVVILRREDPVARHLCRIQPVPDSLRWGSVLATRTVARACRFASPIS